MNLLDRMFPSQGGSRLSAAAAYAIELAVIGLGYFLLAKGGLALASINPSATPIWPPTGLALAAVLLRTYRVWPAILLAAFAANLATAGTIATSLAIALGNTLEAVVGAWLINRFANGRDAYARPSTVVRFALLCFIPTALSASIGVTSLALAGFADWTQFGSIWLTWWLGNIGGALVITPVIVLWGMSDRDSLRWQAVLDSILLFCAAGAVGVIAFSPLMDNTARAPLGFLAVLPLIWSGLRFRPRDTATVALVLSASAVWATFAGAGPFSRETLNDSFLLLVMFVISLAVPSLALSADVAMRKQTEEELRRIQEQLNQRVDARTSALATANAALQEEVEHRKRIEIELDQQRRHLMEAQRVANIGSWVRDVETGQAVWSDQLYGIYGLKPGEFPGTFEGFLKLVHPEDRGRVKDEFQLAISGQGFRGERRIVRPNGEVRYLQNCVEAIRDEHGRVVRLLGICQDVTERRQAEIALERTREQLAQMQKMEAIGQLTGGIAHDFNNLLMIVSGHAEMLRRKLSEPRQLQSVEAIASAARRGESLTRQLLTFSRRQPLNPVPIDLRQRVEAMRAMLGSSLRGNISLAIDMPPDLWPVEADIAELELALVNIAVNARDAMPQGGSFTISARNVAAALAGRGTRAAADSVELALTDTGEGIAPEVMKKIFDPFFTTKAVGKGTGLGLSQVYGFAHQTGGSVQVQSEVGRGTTITLSLPRSRRVATAGAADTAQPPVSRRGVGTILVVEDNLDVGHVTATMLEQIGYGVLRADNASDALAQLQSNGQVDLVLSDIVMPNGMNGIHLAQEVSERYPQIGVLLTTGYSDVAASAETRFPILRKPFELAALERAVREALAGTTTPPGRRAAV